MKNILRIHFDAQTLRPIFACLILAISQVMGNGAHAVPILGANPETSTPVHVAQGAAPLVLLTVARDHSMAFPAYNDMTDLNGDGILDIGFNPTFPYLGLFNPKYCYIYIDRISSKSIFQSSRRGKCVNCCCRSQWLYANQPCHLLERQLAQLHDYQPHGRYACRAIWRLPRSGSCRRN